MEPEKPRAANRQSTLERQQALREKIKAGQLLHRLGQHGMGEVEMTSTQIKAAEILLKKCLPDLKQIEHTGEINGNVNITHITRTIVDPKNDS